MEGGGGGDISSQDSPNTSFQSGFISANTSISDYRAGDSDTGQLEHDDTHNYGINLKTYFPSELFSNQDEHFIYFRLRECC